ncbi:hypothetical protein ED855_19695, partial [Acinetobacter baumannii]
HWGLFDEQRIWDHLGEFLKVGDKMTLTAHDIATAAPLFGRPAGERRPVAWCTRATTTRGWS